MGRVMPIHERHLRARGRRAGVSAIRERRVRPGDRPARFAVAFRSVNVGSSRGQSTVEVVGLLPLLLAVGVAVLSLLSAGRAQEAAGSAAEAGAVALLQGREPRAAARSALAGWPAGRARVRVAGRRVTVRVTPAGPLGAHLRASAVADAGALR